MLCWSRRCPFWAAGRGYKLLSLCCFVTLMIFILSPQRSLAAKMKFFSP